MPVLTAEELLAWLEKTTEGWFQLFRKHPELLTAPCDSAKSDTVAKLLKHIVAVEIRYAQRLANLPVSAFEDIPCDSAEALLATHIRARELYDHLLATPNYDWEETLTFTTLSAGTLASTRRAVLIHALMHSIRHYAQLAPIARHQGSPADWPMDHLMLHAKRI